MVEVGRLVGSLVNPIPGLVLRLVALKALNDDVLDVLIDLMMADWL